MSELDLQKIAAELGEGTERQLSTHSWVTRCPAHKDDTPSLTITEQGERVLVRCHAGCSQEAVIDAMRARDLWPQAEKRTVWVPYKIAPEDAPEPNFRHKKFGKPDKVWTYRAPDGKGVFGYVCRWNTNKGKEILPLSYCYAKDKPDTRSWTWKSFTPPRPIYNQDELQLRPDATVLLVEGEKSADAAKDIFPDYVVTCAPGGSSAARYADWEPLRGRDVVIWPDADAPGAKFQRETSAILNDLGCDVRGVVLPQDLSVDHPGWDLADELPPNYQDIYDLIGETEECSAEGDEVVAKMNREFALTLLGDKAVVLWERMDPITRGKVRTFISLNALRTFKANETVQDGRKTVGVVDYWLAHPERKAYNGVVFEPGKEVPGYLNMWRGFTVRPDPGGDWSLFEKHMRENVAGGDPDLYLWVMGWFAQMMQQPRVKPNTSLTLRGKQGTGKSIVGDIISELIRDNAVLVDDTRYVTGNFNAHMAKALFLQVDEGFFAGDPRNAGRLKGLVTSKTNQIEFKGKDSVTINNYLRLFITSNEDWVVPASLQERRFAVLDVGEGNAQDNEFFQSMLAQMRNGGYGGLLHYLLNFDLSTVDVTRVPKTVALEEQKTFSLGPVEDFWYGILQEGCLGLSTTGLAWPRAVLSDDLYEEYVRVRKTQGDRHIMSKIGFMRASKPLFRAWDLTKKYLAVSDDGEKRVVYHLGHLDAMRESFAERTGLDIDWDRDCEIEIVEKTDDMPF